jgi:ATP-binding cassette, subfamily C, bacterial
MRLMLSFFSAYPLQTFLMLTALLLSGLMEGLGLSALLPLLNVALGSQANLGIALPDAEMQNNFEQQVLAALAWLEIAPSLVNLLLIIVVMVLLKSILLIIANRQVGYTAAQVATDMRLRMLRAIMRSKWEYFLHQPIGKLTNALATEAQRSSTSFVHGATALTYLIQALVYGGVAFALSWSASLAAMAAGAVVIVLSHFLVRVTRRAGKRQTKILTALMSNMTDTLQSVKPLKAMAREHLADHALAGDTNRLNKSLRKAVLAGAVLDGAQELLFAVFIAIGIYAALEIFAMDLPTVMVLVVTLGRAFSFLGKVQKQYQKLAQGESAYWAMLDSIGDAEQAQEQLFGGSPPVFEQGIRFNAVDFSYDQHCVFEGLDLEIPAGKLTTLVGPSGGGKTTIIDLTIGLLQPQTGSVQLDGNAIQELDIRAWRSMIGYVPQETILLHDSVEHNVTLGDPELDSNDVERALRAAGAWEFVEKLTDGCATVVGERGGKLSGGQRQRIVIARALVNQPRLLILDEATSALDSDSEAAIRQTMESLKGELTILAITHNRSMMEAADRVYQLGDGKATLLDSSADSTLVK